MPKKKPLTWKRKLRWRLEWLANSTVEAVFGIFPGVWVFRCGGWLGRAGWYLFPERRKIVIRNLRIAFAGEKSRTEIEELARENFRLTGANLFSAAHVAGLSRGDFRKVLTSDGWENVREVIDGEGGAVIIIPHMGNWEALSRLHLSMPEGVRLGAYYRALNNPLMDARVRARREADGTRVFAKGENPLQMAAALKEPVCLGILADVRVGMAGEPVSFFGRYTRASPLPGLIARRAKRGIASLSNRTTGAGEWQVTFHPVETPPTVQNCMDALERAMRLSPADVFWMQDRWKIYVKASTGIRPWFGDTPVASVKKHRGLIWPGAAGTRPEPPEIWQHAEMEWEYPAEDSGPPTAAVIGKIDDSAALPLDLIISPAEIPGLRKAAKKARIPYYVWS